MSCVVGAYDLIRLMARPSLASAYLSCDEENAPSFPAGRLLCLLCLLCVCFVGSSVVSPEAQPACVECVDGVADHVGLRDIVAGGDPFNERLVRLVRMDVRENRPRLLRLDFLYGVALFVNDP